MEALHASCAAATSARHAVASRRSRGRAGLRGCCSRPADQAQAAHAARVAPAAADVAGAACSARPAHASRAARRWQLCAEPGQGSTGGDEDATYEPMRKARVKGKLQAKVKVSTPTVDAVLSDAPQSDTARAETTAVLALTAVFVAIMVEGLLVAASGFMSEEWDGIVQSNVLPIFAPTLGLFLLGSSSYGAHPRKRRTQLFVPSPALRDGTLTRGCAAGVWKAYGKQ